MEFVDTHAHLYLDRFDEDREEVFERAFDAGVRTIVLPAIDLPSIAAAIDLSRRYDGVYAMAALHPSETKEATGADFEEVLRWSAAPEVVAIGETGLDYYWDRTFDERQQEFVRRHIRLAHDADLPVVFHNREATGDLLRIVAEEKSRAKWPERIRGIFHCFSGTADEAHSIIELGFHLGIGGNVTFKKSRVADEIEGIPLDRLVLETDAPFLTPTPFRGKRNESSYIPMVARFLAEHRGVPVEEIAGTTTAAAKTVFGL